MEMSRSLMGEAKNDLHKNPRVSPIQTLQSGHVKLNEKEEINWIRNCNSSSSLSFKSSPNNNSSLNPHFQFRNQWLPKVHQYYTTTKRKIKASLPIKLRNIISLISIPQPSGK